LVGIVGQMIGGRIADSHELRISYLTFHLATLLPLAGMVMFSELPLLFAAMLYILFSLGLQPIENSLVAKLTPPEWRSTAYGLKFILTFGVGSLAVALVGPIEKLGGLPMVYSTIAGLEIALVCAAFALWAISRRSLLRVANA
jgi:predicted MFS family arabinose efflux permease